MEASFGPRLPCVDQAASLLTATRNNLGLIRYHASANEAIKSRKYSLQPGTSVDGSAVLLNQPWAVIREWNREGSRQA